MGEITETERVMLRELAQVVIIHRAERAMVVGATDKGRTIVELMGEPSEAEVAWDRIRVELALRVREVKS